MLILIESEEMEVERGTGLSIGSILMDIGGTEVVEGEPGMVVVVVEVVVEAALRGVLLRIVPLLAEGVDGETDGGTGKGGRAGRGKRGLRDVGGVVEG